MEQVEKVEKVYPVRGTVDGWVFETKEEETMGVETYIGAEQKIKRVPLSMGRIAEAIELTGKECKKAKVIAGGQTSMIEDAYAALSTKIINPDGSETRFVAEDMDKMKAKDYNAILYISSALNF